MSYLLPGAMMLPEPSSAMRKLSLSSPNHFSGQLVIGDGPGRLVVTDSHLEMNWCLVLLSRIETADLHEQVAFEWSDKFGELHHHYMDFAVTQTDGQRIGYAVRPEERTGGTFAATMPRIAKQARKSRSYADVRLLTEKDLNPVELSNAWLLHGMRTPQIAADAAAATVLTAMTGVCTLSSLADQIGLGADGFRAAIRLIRSHHLCLVRPERVDLTTQVYKRKNTK